MDLTNDVLDLLEATGQGRQQPGRLETEAGQLRCAKAIISAHCWEIANAEADLKESLLRC